jgi:hypothetical protein
MGMVEIGSRLTKLMGGDLRHSKAINSQSREGPRKPVDETTTSL